MARLNVTTGYLSALLDLFCTVSAYYGRTTKTEQELYIDRYCMLVLIELSVRTLGTLTQYVWLLCAFTQTFLCNCKHSLISC